MVAVIVLFSPINNSPFAEVQVYAVLGERFVQQLRHLIVDRGHDLIQRLDEADAETRMPEVLRHLKADESAADNRRPAHARARGCGRYPVRSRASARERS